MAGHMFMALKGERKGIIKKDFIYIAKASGSSKKEAKKIFKFANLNNNNRIDFEEFVNLYY